MSHTPIVSKISSRMDQFASAIQVTCQKVFTFEMQLLSVFTIVSFPQGNKEVKSSKSPVADIPTGGTRNIKNMWEKGNISSSSESPAPTVKVSTTEGERVMKHSSSAFPRMWRASEAAWLDGSVVGRQSLRRRRRARLLHRPLSPNQHRHRHRHLQNQQ